MDQSSRELADDGAQRRIDAPAFDSPLDRLLLLERLTSALVAEPSTSADVAPVIGRFSILRKLGRGGMGVVYLGYDEQLDRKLAVKLLRADKQHPLARQRMLREARALARLCHPHVVQIYEIGEDAGSTFIAMEFVAGHTLGEWLVDTQPSVHELLRVFIEAGRGLAAAHAAGLVHRDFKPANVMITPDGHAKVSDFGLVRPTELDNTDSDCGASADARAETELTRTGARIGTPAYMSAEQHRGQLGDARSDQFSFCVALWEALYGERPFAGSTVSAISSEVTAGRVREPAPVAGVPGRLRSLLERGLSVDPAARWPNMDELLAALQRVSGEPARRRRWVAGSLVAGSLVVATVALLWSTTIAAPQGVACQQFEAELVGVWDQARRRELSHAFEATHRRYAADTWARVSTLLDDYAQAWVAARTDACQATLRGEQSDALLDRRMACLDQRLYGLAALVDSLATTNDGSMAQAIAAVRNLPSLERCADLDALASELPPPDDPWLAARVAQLDRRLAELRSLREARGGVRALDLANALAREAEQLGYEPTLARVELERGGALLFVSELPAAEAALRRAYELGLSHRMLELAARASERLAYLVGYRLERHAEGQTWALHALTLARAADINEAEAINVSGVLAFSQGQTEAAQQRFEQALQLRMRELGPDHPLIARSYNNLGMVALELGDNELARAHLQRALELVERVLGPEHPHIITPMAALARLANIEGKHAEAVELTTRAIDMTESAYGSESPLLVDVLRHLGDARVGLGQPSQAVEPLERALALSEQAGLNDAWRADCEFTLARALWPAVGDRRRGDSDSDPDPARAVALAERARERYAAITPTPDSDLAEVEQWLAERPTAASEVQ